MTPTYTAFGKRQKKSHRWLPGESKGVKGLIKESLRDFQSEENIPNLDCGGGGYRSIHSPNQMYIELYLFEGYILLCVNSL